MNGKVAWSRIKMGPKCTAKKRDAKSVFTIRSGLSSSGCWGRLRVHLLRQAKQGLTLKLLCLSIDLTPGSTARDSPRILKKHKIRQCKQQCSGTPTSKALAQRPVTSKLSGIKLIQGESLAAGLSRTANAPPRAAEGPPCRLLSQLRRERVASRLRLITATKHCSASTARLN